MKFTATKVKGKDLKAGDLFSTAGESYWNEQNVMRNLSVGEKVYIRTEVPLPEGELEADVYKIEVEEEEKVDKYLYARMKVDLDVVLKYSEEEFKEVVDHQWGEARRDLLEEFRKRKKNGK